VKFECSRLDQALRDQDSALLDAARRHAESCPACREQLEQWDGVSTAASLLRHREESPELWERIRESLTAESTRLAAKPTWPVRLRETFSQHWMFPMAAAAVLVIAAASSWVMLRPTEPSAQRQFLTERALREVEASEAAYIKSIDNLSRLAQPCLDDRSPLMAAYREKLVVLDSAISEIRDAAEGNRLNAYLQAELVSLYQEKQKTLKEVLRHAHELQQSN
jgi:hypothetical protein